MVYEIYAQWIDVEETKKQEDIMRAIWNLVPPWSRKRNKKIKYNKINKLIGAQGQLIALYRHQLARPATYFQ